MMHKAWSSIEEVSYFFSRSSVKFQGHTALKIVEFHPNLVFPDSNSSYALLFFKVIHQISTSHGSKNRRIWPKLGISGLLLKFQYTNGSKMMHKAWSRIEEVPYFFQGHPSNFKVIQDKKIADFDPNWGFPDCNFSLNSPMDLKLYTKLDVV